MKKIFVIDTNVVLHDSSCIDHFQEHDIVLPLTVLEELDNIDSEQNRAKYSDTVIFHARNFTRLIDTYQVSSLMNGGIPLGGDRGNLYMRAHTEYHSDLVSLFMKDKADHRIINTAYKVSKEFPDKLTILVTKDVNARTKARALGLCAENYTYDQVNPDNVLNNIEVLTDVDDEFIARIFSDDKELCDGIERNSFTILQADDKEDILLYNDLQRKKYAPVVVRKAASVLPRNTEQVLAAHILMDPNIPLVCITGPAGTGKTLLALAAAIEQKQRYWQILLTRPIVPLSGKDIGALPGDVNDKIRPYMQPLFDNINFIKEAYSSDVKQIEKLNKMVSGSEDRAPKIIVEPLTYIRGRSLPRRFLIIDEGQNLTPHEVKTIVTRAGEGTKIVFTGDIHQIDAKFLDKKTNGLSYMIDKMGSCPLFAHIDLVKGERSVLAEIAGNLL